MTPSVLVENGTTELGAATLPKHDRPLIDCREGYNLASELAAAKELIASSGDKAALLRFAGIDLDVTERTSFEAIKRKFLQSVFPKGVPNGSEAILFHEDCSVDAIRLLQAKAVALLLPTTIEVIINSAGKSMRVEPIDPLFNGGREGVTINPR